MPIIKRLELTSGLIYDWLSLPDYVSQETDVSFSWSDNFHYGNMVSQILHWKRLYGLIDCFITLEIYRQPINDYDGSFRGPDVLIARFPDKKSAMHFKLAEIR